MDTQAAHPPSAIDMLGQRSFGIPMIEWLSGNCSCKCLKSNIYSGKIVVDGGQEGSARVPLHFKIHHHHHIKPAFYQ